jgi:hypothetical protein
MQSIAAVRFHFGSLIVECPLREFAANPPVAP